MMRTSLSIVLVITLCAMGCSGRAVTGDAEQEDAPIGDPVEEDAPPDASDDPDAEPPTDVVEEETFCDPSERTVEDFGDLPLDHPIDDVDLAQCAEHRFTFVAAAGSTVDIEMMAHGYYRIQGSVLYPDDPDAEEVIEAFETATGGMTDVFSFEVPRSGEFVLALHTTRPEAVERYDLNLTCSEGCDLVTTRFPIVMVHGWTGWESVGSYTYFYGIPDLLESQGYLVFVPALDPYNHTVIRSQQLATLVETYLHDGRARKVNIIAHSQGGLDSRRMISTLGYGDRVSALVTFATPHRGTPITDIAMGVLPGPGEDALYFLIELLGASVVGSESDAEASFESMTTDYVQNTFNPENPDDPRVSYISWTGLTCPLGITCGDMCDLEITFSYDIIYLAAGDNDGIVPVSSAIWGDYRGTVPADHFDEVGQLAGITGPNFDHEEFYSDVALILIDEGH